MKKYFVLAALMTFGLLTFSACNKNDELCELDPPSGDLVFCTEEYEPVCGCDGKTYGNDCKASIAGVPSVTPGECP